MASPSLQRAGESGKPAGGFSRWPGGGCRSRRGLLRWLPGLHASGGPEDALRDRPSVIPASVRGTDPLSPPLRSPRRPHGLSPMTPSVAHTRAVRGWDRATWVGLSRGPHLGKGCLGGGLGSGHAFRPGSRGIATPEGGFPGGVLRNSPAGVRGRAPFCKPWRLGTARRVRWGFAGGLETRSSQDGFLIPLPV